MDNKKKYVTDESTVTEYYVIAEYSSRSYDRDINDDLITVKNFYVNDSTYSERLSEASQYDSYPEAIEVIQTLSEGEYQIEKYFNVKKNEKKT